MLLLLLAVLQVSTTGIDASTLKVSPATTVAELDLGKLKGELRQICWSPDATALYVQTAEGAPGSEKLRHYSVSVNDGTETPLDAEPEWATIYWNYKSDRFAPGLRSIAIEMEQKLEKTKIGTGSGRPGATGGSFDATGVDLDKTAEGQRQNVVRLTLFGENISEFVNERPMPGLMFSWGPIGSATIAYVERDGGRLMLLDREKRKRAIAGTRDALLPTWSIDGSRLAWVQKTGRKKYTLVWAAVGH